MFRKKMGVVTKALLVTAMAMVVAFSANAWPRRDAAGSKSDLTTTLFVPAPVKLNGQTVKPGTYTVKANDSTVTLEMNGKQVAQAPVQWKDTTDKAKNSNLLADSGAIKEIHFGGKTKYVVIAE